MTEYFPIEQIVNDINDNITTKSRLIYEIDAFSKFIEKSISDIKSNHPDNNYRKYLLTILEKSKLAMYNFNSRVLEIKKLTFLELYSFYEIVSNVLNGINIYSKSTQFIWELVYNITDDEYIVLEKL